MLSSAERFQPLNKATETLDRARPASNVARLVETPHEGAERAPVSGKEIADECSVSGTLPERDAGGGSTQRKKAFVLSQNCGKDALSYTASACPLRNAIDRPASSLLSRVL